MHTRQYRTHELIINIVSLEDIYLYISEIDEESRLYTWSKRL